jgi:hypothetical protein
MKEDRPIWLTSLADADRGMDAPDALEARLQGALRRRRGAYIAKRTGAVGLVVALSIGLWIAPKRQSMTDGEVADDSVLDAITEAASIVVDDDDAIADFVPTQLASEQPLESVRVVRVSLPEGALSANTDVTADLLVGQDGIARAIRVVK